MYNIAKNKKREQHFCRPPGLRFLHQLFPPLNIATSFFSLRFFKVSFCFCFPLMTVSVSGVVLPAGRTVPSKILIRPDTSVSFILDLYKFFIFLFCFHPVCSTCALDITAVSTPRGIFMALRMLSVNSSPVTCYAIPS